MNDCIALIAIAAFCGLATLASAESPPRPEREKPEEPEKKEPAVKTQSVEGKVVEINRGKDGYTAKIETDTKEIWFVTISMSNLKDPKQYRSVPVGGRVSVSGDFWKLKDQSHLTVREMK